jgi:hypothetical protein
MEYNKVTETVVQVASNNIQFPEDEQVVTEENTNIPEFIECLLEFVKQVKPKVIDGIDNLENTRILKSKAITKSGELKEKSEVKKEDILWPTPVLTLVQENVPMPLFEEIDVQEFLKQKKATTTEVGIHSYNILNLSKNKSFTEAPKKVNVYKLNKKYTDEAEIFSELNMLNPEGKIKKEHLWTWNEICNLIKAQSKLVNGIPNEGILNLEGHIFHLEEETGKQFTVSVFWDDEIASWGVLQFNVPHSWPDDNSVLLRQS